ncbi:hypothetical protein FE257_008855 [Aspergillus nanangensis]|uniref:Uncharacterized protein n=1 Tax=Aspergillus nanangensis TaxID=2582783 RepID=A0AAD4CKN3_ASPNN|nr:hypothetical protein FE257_008855 [Aspergillus nanangensis]
MPRYPNIALFQHGTVRVSSFLAPFTPGVANRLIYCRCAARAGETTADLTMLGMRTGDLLPPFICLQRCEVPADANAIISPSLGRNAPSSFGPHRGVGPWAQLTRDASLAVQARPGYTLAPTAHQ